MSVAELQSAVVRLAMRLVPSAFPPSCTPAIGSAGRPPRWRSPWR